jgi:hypothetical protein
MKQILKYCLFLLSFVWCEACRSGYNEEVKADPKRLSSERIVQLVDKAGFELNDNENLHLLYDEYLNDSTWVIRVVQNKTLGDEQFGVCEVLKINYRNIFVYGGEYCHEKLSEDLRCKSDEWPFQFDGATFLLLVEIRNGLLGYYTLNRRSEFSNDLPDSSDLIFLK